MASTNLWLWFMLAVTRFVWTLVPQSGYIHPDEFFQSVEIVAGDLFHLNVTRTWEFNSQAPVRSIVPIYVVAGLPLLLLRTLSQTIGTPAVSWYTVTVIVRCTLTALSFVVDFCAYRLARIHGRRVDDVMLVVASSYVTLVFYTRPFSNTIESFLFVLLLLHVSNSKTTLTSYSEQASSSSSDIIRHSSSSSAAIMILVVSGVFNRPTFVVYSIVPCLFWLFQDTDFKARLKRSVILVASRSFHCLNFGVIFAALFVICDSVYFGRMSVNVSSIFDELIGSRLPNSLLNLTITPLNFVLYNTRADNLAEHGVHPRVTHALVNTPLLFGILGLFFIVDTLFLPACFLRHRKAYSDRNCFLVVSILVPLTLLSAFPHQEPRFLIPLLLPLVLIYSHKITGKGSRSWFTTLWVVGNVICCLFFGVCHQGGLIPALGHIQQERSIGSCNGNYHVIFWHTYMPPKHLLLTAKSDTTQMTDICLNGYLEVHDFAGRSIEEVNVLVKSLHSRDKLCHVKSHIRLVAPGSRHSDLACVFDGGFQWQLSNSFWPHISTEDLPMIESILCTDAESNSCISYSCKSYDFAHRLILSTSLNVYDSVFTNQLVGLV